MCDSRLLARTAGAMLLGLTAALPLQLTAAPMVVEETARIPNPDPTYSLNAVAIDGDYLLVTAARLLIPGEDDCCQEVYESTAYMYQRDADGTWQPVPTFAKPQGIETLSMVPMVAGMEGGIAALVTGSKAVSVYERSGAGWIPAQVDARGFVTTDIEIDGSTILLSASPDDHQAFVLTKNEAGRWVHVDTLEGPRHDGADYGSAHPAGDVDISGNTVVIGGDAIYDDVSGFEELHVFSGSPQAYVKTSVLPAPAISVAVNRDTLLGSSRYLDRRAVHVFERRDGVNWIPAPSLIRSDADANSGPGTLDLTDEFALVSYPVDTQRGVGSIGVFQRDQQGAFEHVATLLASDALSGGTVGASFDNSGRRVAVASADAVYIYDLPADFMQPADVQDDFESGSAQQWTWVAGSKLSVVASGVSRVFRQTNVQGNAGALLPVDRANQTITADITPRAFEGSDRWFGLVVRYQDEQNFYYVTVRASNVVQLKKMVGGVFRTIASVPMSVALNRTYRVQLEAVGTLLRLYVDGKLVAQASDTDLTHGLSGIRMFKTRADYDNVIVTSGPRLRLSDSNYSHWTWPPEGDDTGHWLSLSDDAFPTEFIRQTDLSGLARLLAGVPTDMQIVETRARATNLTTSTQSWFGVFARYVDEGNYYYVTVRRDNTIALRKLVNGAIHVLDSAPFSVKQGTWYKLRLEAIGDKLRVHVNGKLLLQATDTSFATGRYGLLMHKTVGEYVDLEVSQP